MCTIEKRDVKLTRKRAILRLRHTKTLGAKRQDSELAIVSSKLAVRMLAQILPKLQKTDKIAGCTAGALRSHVNRTVSALKLGRFGYKLHSWRRGGSTEDFLSHGSLEKTLLKGRWASSEVARDYLAEATAALAKADLSKAETRLMKQKQGQLKAAYGA